MKALNKSSVSMAVATEPSHTERDREREGGGGGGGGERESVFLRKVYTSIQLFPIDLVKIKLES